MNFNTTKNSPMMRYTSEKPVAFNKDYWTKKFRLTKRERHLKNIDRAIENVNV